MTREFDDQIGLAIIGCGMVGTLRARVAARHRGVRFLAVHDIDQDRAADLAKRTGADLCAATAEEALNHPDVDVAIISTKPDTHLEFGLAAMESNHTVLVEKPFGDSVAQAAELVAQAEQRSVQLFAGYSQRFRRRFLSGKTHVLSGEIGEVTGGLGTFYTTRGLAERVVAKDPRASPARNNFPHIADLSLWYMEGREALNVTARSSFGTVAGRSDVPLTTWCMVEFDNRALYTIGTSRELPRQHPAYHASLGLQLFGTEGALMIDDSHRDYILSTEAPITALEAPYTPDLELRTAFMGTFPPGTSAFDAVWGCMKEETEAFIDAASSRAGHPILAKGVDGLNVRRLVEAVEVSSSTGETVGLTG